MSVFDAIMGDVHAACDEIFAHAALFKPAAGEARACSVELFLPEPEFGETAKTVIPDTLFRVVKAQLPAAPRARDLFDLGARGVFRVLASPTTEDDDGLRWTIKVEKVR
ncbi:MAG TPA: hypothetical protein PLS69_08990 [Terricaulis sp.]|nr:hypothetical protein [Terricaulis sp.]